MYMICRHIKTNGLRCESPALKGQPFCYYHSKAHSVGAEPHLKYGPLQLPTPEDAASIQLSVARISDAIINGRIDLKKATGLLYGLQIAAQSMHIKQRFDQQKTVQSAELTVQGEELAPGEFVCNEDVDNCGACPYAASGECARQQQTKIEKFGVASASQKTDCTAVKPLKMIGFNCMQVKSGRDTRPVSQYRPVIQQKTIDLNGDLRSGKKAVQPLCHCTAQH